LWLVCALQPRLLCAQWACHVYSVCFSAAGCLCCFCTRVQQACRVFPGWCVRISQFCCVLNGLSMYASRQLAVCAVSLCTKDAVTVWKVPVTRDSPDECAGLETGHHPRPDTAVWRVVSMGMFVDFILCCSVHARHTMSWLCCGCVHSFLFTFYSFLCGLQLSVQSTALCAVNSFLCCSQLSGQ
jgi:hypothetical protein